MFGMVLNTPLSYYDSVCNYNTNDNIALPNSETHFLTKVLNGQRKWVINLIFPLVQDSSLFSLAVLKPFTTTIFYYAGETLP